MDIIRLAGIGGDDTMNFRRVVERFNRFTNGKRHFFNPVEIADYPPGNRQRMAIVRRIVVGDSRGSAMDFRSSEILGADHLANGSLDKRRSGQKDSALTPDDDTFIRHGRHVCAASGAGAHDSGNLGNILAGHVGLVIEDPAEVITIREDLFLTGEKHPAGIDQINAGKIARFGNFLGAQMFFYGKRVISAPFNRGIVGKDHTLLTLDPTDAGNNPGGRHVVAVHFIGGKLGQFEERCTNIKQLPDTFTGE